MKLRKLMAGIWTAPNCAYSTKKPLWRNELSNELASQFKRSQFCFELYALMIVEIDVIINELFCFRKSLNLCSVNTLCFEDREEIFCQSVIIGIPTSWHGRDNVVWLSQLKILLWSVLKALVTVELQLSGDLFLFLSSSDSIQNKIYVLNSRESEYQTV